MSNEQAPESCPFCGAAFKGATEDGVDREFRCGTWVASEILSPQRTPRCITAERERLTRDLVAALARVKRLEEAGSKVANILSSKTPDVNCSCHIAAPCSDCVDHGGSREALDDWYKAREATP